VKHFAEHDRRQHQRFPHVLEVHARSLPPIQTPLVSAKEFEGRIQNLSQGGACILSTLPLPAANFLRCDIAVPDLPVPIPTLMQVRWTAKRGHKTVSYLNGLSFVI
jgi:hypothetical protein